MEKKELSQSRAAVLFGMDQARLSHILDGKRMPGLRLATRIQIYTEDAVPMWDWHGEDERRKRAASERERVQRTLAKGEKAA